MKFLKNPGFHTPPTPLSGRSTSHNGKQAKSRKGGHERT